MGTNWILCECSHLFKKLEIILRIDNIVAQPDAASLWLQGAAKLWLQYHKNGCFASLLRASNKRPLCDPSEFTALLSGAPRQIAYGGGYTFSAILLLYGR